MRIFSGYLTRLPWRRSMLSLAIAAAAAICGGMATADAPAPTEVRDTLPLMENWRFVRDDALPRQEAQASADAATSDKARSSAPEGAAERGADQRKAAGTCTGRSPRRSPTRRNLGPGKPCPLRPRELDNGAAL